MTTQNTDDYDINDQDNMLVTDRLLYWQLPAAHIIIIIIIKQIHFCQHYYMYS